MAPERLSPRTTQVSGKAVIHPAARCARCGRVCMGNQRALSALARMHAYQWFWVMPFGARSAAGSMSALSLTLKVRGDRRSGAIHHLRRDVNRGWRWRFERLSLPTFFAAAKKVGAAPHRGNAGRPPRKQGKANGLKQSQKNHSPSPSTISPSNSSPYSLPPSPAGSRPACSPNRSANPTSPSGTNTYPCPQTV